MRHIALDELYKMVSRIYAEQNAQRSATATFAHFVEVCGMLAIHDRKKKRDAVNVDSALCKALGWFFPLMAKFRVKSVEELVFRKYPYACPYCRRCPHEDSMCKSVRGAAPGVVDHGALRELAHANVQRIPTSLTGWQQMFADIYPRRVDEANRSTLGLFEEVGELAEAIRVYERHPKYFAGEAADVFSYLMGIANEHALRMEQGEDRRFDFEDAFLKAYPGLCAQCGNDVCMCPAIPEATVGRMSKEMNLDDANELFGLQYEEMLTVGESTARSVLERIGGEGLGLELLPTDRGAVNKTLGMVFLHLASQVRMENGELANSLTSAALRISASAAAPGSRERSPVRSDEMALLRAALETTATTRSGENGALWSALTMLAAKRVLLISADPRSEARISVSEEVAAIQEAVKRSKYRDCISLEVVHAATVDDFRRALLDKTYDIVHFSGHLDELGFVFVDPQEDGRTASLPSLAEVIAHYSSIQCVVLNGCRFDGSTRLANYTIGMKEEISDGAAVEFARGFYDAIGAGLTYERAAHEGANAAILKEYACPVLVLTR